MALSVVLRPPGLSPSPLTMLLIARPGRLLAVPFAAPLVADELDEAETGVAVWFGGERSAFVGSVLRSAPPVAAAGADV